MPDDPKEKAEVIRMHLMGLMYQAFQRGRDSMCGTAGNKDRFYEQAGAGLCTVAEDVDKLHEAYLAFAREQVKAAKGGK